MIVAGDQGGLRWREDGRGEQTQRGPDKNRLEPILAAHGLTHFFAALQIELAVDAVNLRFHGIDGDNQLRGDLSVRVPGHQQAKHPLLGLRETGRGTRRAAERFRIHPDEISSLPPGEAVLISKLPERSVRTVRVTPPQHDGPER